MGAWILENCLITALVMLAVFGLCRMYKHRPALCHFLWVLAFASLVMPPIRVPFAPGTLLRSELASWLPVSAPESEPAAAMTQGLVAPASARVPSAPASSALMETVSTPVAEPGRVALLLSSLSALQWVIVLWVLGALLFLGESARRILSFNRHVRRAAEAPPRLRAAVDAVAGRMGVGTLPVKLIEGVGSPAIWCFGRPRLLWPAQDGRPVRHAGEPSLIAHELAHLARKDHWVARLDVLAIGLCWWNPLFWIIRREIRDYAELSCDAWALWAYPTRRQVYAEALIDAQERSLIAPLAVQGLCATNTEFRNFERRLSMIMSKNVSRRTSRGVAAAALLTTLLVLPGFSTQQKGHKLKQHKTSATSSQCIDELVEVKQLSKAAEKLFASKQYDAAIEAFGEVLAIDPQNGMAHARLGFMFVSRGEYERATKHFQTEVALGHEPATAIYNLACAAALSGNHEGALAYLEQSVQRGFTNSELMSKDKDLASLRGRVAYDKALEASKQSAMLRKKLTAKAGKTEFAQRAKLYMALAEIASQDGELQDECGLACLQAKEFEGALRAFKHQLAAGYEVGRANYNSACAYALTARREQALQALERAAAARMVYAGIRSDVDLESLHGDARFDVAAESIMAPKALQKKIHGAISSGEVEKAAGVLSKLMEDPESTAETRAWAAYELGRLQFKAQDASASIESFQRAAAGGYEVEAAAFHIGTAYAALGNFDAALQNFDNALLLGFVQPEKLEQALEAYGLAETAKAEDLLRRANKLAAERAKKKKTLKKKKQESTAVSSVSHKQAKALGSSSSSQL